MEKRTRADSLSSTDGAWLFLSGFVAPDEDSENECDVSTHLRVTLGKGTSELRSKGVARVLVESPEALVPLRKLAEAILEADTWQAVVNTESGQEVPAFGEALPKFRRHCFVGSDRLFWLYPCNEEDMQIFDPLATSVFPAVSGAAEPGSDLQLCAASLVVLKDRGARDSDVHAHRDWESSNLGLPPRTAYTVLVPLVLPTASAGLELYKESRELIGVAQYVLGEGIAFDNGQLHRTQPGRSPSRILASLSFAPTAPELWISAERVLKSQTPHFYRRPVDGTRYW